MLNRILFWITTLLVLSSTSVGAWAKDRYALVVGNSSYQAVTALPNPGRDALAVEQLLTSSGFEVTTAVDLGQKEMRRAVSDFAAKLANKSKDTVALVYFAGHGVQLDGQNYLLPVDAKLTREADIALEAVRLSDVMNVLNTIPSATRIVILDACRNNPFEGIISKGRRGLARVDENGAKTPVRNVPGGNTVARGLAIVNAPAGTLVAYSTSPGSTAEDGAGTNSPFTKALIEAAKKPGAPIESVFQNVRLAVHSATEGRQTPWEVTALTKRFSFFPGDSESAPAPEKSEREWVEELRSVSPDRAYETVIVQNNVTVYQIFVSIFPNNPLTLRINGLLERRLEMQAWFDAITLNTVAGFNAFLKLYPDSDLAVTAKRLSKRAKLRSAVASAAPGALGLTSTPTVKTVVKEVRVPTPPVIKTVVREVRVPSPPEIRTVIKEVRVPVYKTKIREIIKEVRVPVYKTRTIVKEVRVPVYKTRTVIKRVHVRRPCRCSRPNRVHRSEPRRIHRRPPPQFRFAPPRHRRERLR